MQRKQVSGIGFMIFQALDVYTYLCLDEICARIRLLMQVTKGV